MKQGTILTAKADFQFRNNSNRMVRVRTGQRFWITTTEVFANQHNAAKIDREGKGHISGGNLLALADIRNLFEVE